LPLLFLSFGYDDFVNDRLPFGYERPLIARQRRQEEWFHSLHRGLDAVQGVAGQCNLVRGVDQAETLLFFSSLMSSAKANRSNGSSRLASADTSIFTARAFGSLAQHSGDFVLMGFNWLMTMATRRFETAAVVRRAATEAQQIAMQPLPKADAAVHKRTGWFG
jgi:hypothetical protein